METTRTRHLIVIGKILHGGRVCDIVKTVWEYTCPKGHVYTAKSSSLTTCRFCRKEGK